MGQVPRVALIGAGSLSHGKRLIDDLLTVQELAGGRLALMGTNLPRLEIIGRYARRAAATLLPSLELLVTDDRNLALEGADVVIALFDAGGFPAFDQDCRITESYGLDVCIGDTVGPLGTMRALRNGPVMLALADAMKAACPDALLINYVNPMAPMVAAASSRGIECVGICGGIESTRSYIATVLGLDLSEIETNFAGVNHLCWLLELRGRGEDLYPRFRELMADPMCRGEEAVRFEILQQFGYFSTESSGHSSDFFPWFRKSPELRARYCSGPGYSGASGAYRRLCSFVQRRIGQADYLEGETPSPRRSGDYGPAIVEAVLGGARRSFYGNVMNQDDAGRPFLAELPPGSCVELLLLLEGRRLIVQPPPRLPTALAALCMPSALQHNLILEALISEDPELVFATIAQDQLTSSILDLPSLRSLSAELLAANAAWLPRGLQAPLRATVDAGIRGKFLPQLRQVDSSFELVRNYERRWKKRSEDSEPSRDS
jgi:alpha-galactosidase